MKISCLRCEAELSCNFYLSRKQITNQHEVITQKTLFAINNAVNTSNHRVNYSNSPYFWDLSEVLLLCHEKLFI